MDPRSPIMFLANYALAQAKTPERAPREPAPQEPEIKTPKPLRTTLTTPVPGKSSPSTASRPTRTPTRTPTRSSPRPTRPSIDKSKGSLLSRGACVKHFKTNKGKPTKQSIEDAYNCVIGKCSGAAAAKVDAKPAEEPTDMSDGISEALYAVKQAKLAMFAANAAMAKAEKTLEKFI